MQRSETAAVSKPRFTPGPWSVEDPMGPEIISIVANGAAEAYDWKHIAQLAGKPEDSDDIPAHEARANAHLIASAPDLLAAAKAFRKAFDELFALCGSNGLFNARGDQLDCTLLNEAARQNTVALAKAEGR